MDTAKWQTSPIFLTVREIAGGKDVPYKSKIKAIIHTAERDYAVFKVLEEHIVRDYFKNMMDDVLIKVMVPLGDYIYLIYPNKDHLEITVSKTPLVSIGDMQNDDMPIEEIRYKCIFDIKNPSYMGTEFIQYDQTALNNAQFATFSLRLMDRNAEPLRVKTTQGIFRGVTAKDLIGALLLGESQNVLVDGVPCASGLDLVEPDNQIPYSQIAIRSGEQICNIPTLLQEQDGVYKHAIGTYFQRYNKVPTWFVYPLYDFDRYDNKEERDVAIFYSSPKQYTAGIERTYRNNAGILEVVVTTDKYQMNVSEINQLNQGVGYRMSDQKAFMKKPVVIDENGYALGSRDRLNNEISFIDRKDGLNYTPTIYDRNTNPFHETSKVAARQISHLQFGWINADESKIYPGMPMKFVYMQDNVVCELKGTILGIHVMRLRQGKIMEPDRYTTNCVLSVAAELNRQLPEYDGEQSFDPTA